LKLNGTHYFLVDAIDVNILGGSVHTIKENVEALLVASKEYGLEVHGHHLEISMHDKVTVWKLIIVPLKRWKSSNI
jgi:hypothetical protein